MSEEKKFEEDSESYINKDLILETKEFDLYEILRATKRKWKIFTSTILLSFSLGLFYVNYKSPVWEGQFKIVIAKKNTSSSLLNSISSSFGQQPFLQRFLTSNEIDTELEILESLSVLKPVFNFVKNEKSKNGIDVSKLKFSKWKKDHFEIEKIGRTPVLSITYYDEEKDLVEPTLVEISKTYQNYSGRDRSENLNLVVNYLEKQIEIYKKKKEVAFSNLQKFAIQNNLPFSSDGYALEKDRLEEAFKIDFYKKQSDQLDSIVDDSRTLIYIGGLYPQINKLGLPEKLQRIDTEIAFLKKRFRENDPFFIQKKKEREIIYDELLISISSFLKAKLFDSEAKFKASERPQEVLLTYSELLRNSENYSNTLINLQRNKETISLERARKEKPWELITPVTVLDAPSYPRKLRIVAFSLLLGGIFGVFFAAYMDYRSGLIYSLHYFKKNLKYKLLRTIFFNSDESINQTIELLKRGPLKINQNESVGLIIPFKKNSEILDNFLKEFKIVFKDYSIKISSNILESEKCKKRIIVILPGFITRKKLQSIQEEIDIQNKNIEGWIYLN